MLTEEGYVSENITKEESATNHPFFRSLATNNISIKDINNSIIIQDQEKIFLHPEILKLYEIIGYDKEYNYKNYTFMTLNEIIERKNNYTNFYDIALTYIGMGHILLISYYPTKNNFFFRRDGGSNGYDREEYYNKYKNFIIEENENEEYKNIEENENPTTYLIDKLYTFEQIVSILNNSENNY